MYFIKDGLSFKIELARSQWLGLIISVLLRDSEFFVSLFVFLEGR